jgi:hypothetical protein
MSIRAWLRMGIGLLSIYALLCLVVFMVQRRLLYFPDQGAEAEAIQRAHALGLAPWRDGEGRLQGWRQPRTEPAPWRVLVFHGNAGNALDRAYYLALFDARRFDLVLFEYPGYGGRPGEPGERTFVEAGRAAFTQLSAEGPVLVLGESLGSGVAAQIAAALPDRVPGLLLVTPFASMAEVASQHYPWLPVRRLLRDRWESGAALRGYRGPVAILVAGRDEVVGAAQGRRLAAACAGPVRIFEQARASHNALDLRRGSPPWDEMLAFLLAER